MPLTAVESHTAESLDAEGEVLETWVFAGAIDDLTLEVLADMLAAPGAEAVAEAVVLDGKELAANEIAANEIAYGVAEGEDFWTAPGLSRDEAGETAQLWRSWGIACGAARRNRRDARAAPQQPTES